MGAEQDRFFCQTARLNCPAETCTAMRSGESVINVPRYASIPAVCIPPALSVARAWVCCPSPDRLSDTKVTPVTLLGPFRRKGRSPDVVIKN